jgi:GNAT superfamily N-acetyltransferase
MTERINDTSTVVRATTNDAGALSMIIADAFHDLAPSRWLVPDAIGRRAIFPTYFGLFVAHALDTGVVHTTPSRDAVALWVPVPETGPSQPADYEHQLAAATSPWTPQFMAFDTALDRHHPMGTAHHHLAILAVRPDRQGLGIGSALLSAHHAMLDREGMPAYLEAATWRVRYLYLAHGYRDYGYPIELPEGPFMYPMWREPRLSSG